VFGQIFCTGDYVPPGIVARASGTAVHYGIKFECSDPVSYSIHISVQNFYDAGPDPQHALEAHPGAYR